MKPKMKAWDFVHEDIETVTKSGYNVSRTPHEIRLGELLDKFQDSNLSVEQIGWLGEVVRLAHWIGKDDKEQS